VVERDRSQIYFPTLQVNDAKTVTRTRKYGPMEHDFFWFKYPHQFEYQQAFKVEIYCTLEFIAYPFDSQECNFTFGSSITFSKELHLKETWLRYRNERKKFGEGPLEIETNRLPFFISLESLQEHIFTQAGYDYSFVGMKMTLTRNNFGLLIGGYYGPTGMFSLLSLASFTINPEIVSKNQICFDVTK
jgi:hypothetical protein